jgi:hypothetical protein
LNCVHRDFDRFYGQKLQVHDIGLQVHVIAKVLHIEPQTERRLKAYLEWLRTHWEVFKPRFAEVCENKKRSLHELAAICLWSIKKPAIGSFDGNV